MNSAVSRWSLLVALNLVLTGAAQAAPHGIYWADGKAPARAAASGNLEYHGGPVISNAKVYAVFWGDKVNTETQQKIGSFFGNVLDSKYMDWLSEYDTTVPAVDGRAGTQQKIGRGSFGGSFLIQPSISDKHLKDEQIRKELEDQIAAGHLPAPDANSLYMTYFPSGVSVTIETYSSCSTFCAYHEGFQSKTGASIYYGVMPVCAFGCDVSLSKFDSMTTVSSHEMIEAITDPLPTAAGAPAYPQAWNTASGEEIGDVCVGRTSKVTGHGITSLVQQEWDNSIKGCASGPWTQFEAMSTRLSAPAASVLRSRPFPMLESLQTNASSWDGR